MGDNNNSEQKPESLMEKIGDMMMHSHDDSSSFSDSSPDKKKPHSPSSIKSKIWRLFGRDKPIHSVFGGGKPADVFLWRNKKISAGVLGGATAIWILIELMEYHLLTLVCHFLILALAALFIWSNVARVINKPAPHIPDVKLDEKLVLQLASALRSELNSTLDVLRKVALGREVNKFLAIIFGLWILSILGSWCNFLTLLYIAFVLLHTLPVLYEKYAHTIDSYAETAMIELKKLYAVFDANVLSKIPRGALKDKKNA